MYVSRMKNSSRDSLFTAQYAHHFKKRQRKAHKEEFVKTTQGKIRFLPFAVECFGGVIQQSVSFLIPLAQELSSKRKQPISICATYLYKVISAAVQMGNSRALVAK